MIGLLTTSLAPILLYVARCGGVLVSAPGFNPKQMPIAVKLLLLLAMGVSMYAALGPGRWAGADPVMIAGAVPLEFLIGVSMGFAARLVLAAVEVAGEFLAFQMGFAAAAVFDPTVGSSVSPPTRMLYTVAVLLFFSIDGHHQVLLALAGSYEYVPVGAAGLDVIQAQVFLELAYGLFEVGVRLAFPLVFVMLIINLTLGMIVRFVPQVNVFMIGFILTMGVGLLLLAELMPSLGVAILGMLETIGETLPLLLRP